MMQKNTFYMKHLILDNKTEFLGKVLVFQPGESMRNVRFVHRGSCITSDYPRIIGEKANRMLRDDDIILRNYIYNADDWGILHTESLDTLHFNYPWYFEKIYEAATKADFFIHNTFVYESPEIVRCPLFPQTPQEFLAKIRGGELSIEAYDRLYPIPGYKSFIERYMEGEMNIGSFLSIYNWINQKTIVSPFQHFLDARLILFNKMRNEEKAEKSKTNTEA